ncbi:MAG TPA: zinc-binding dehydrogenase [Porticoccaceae bacterium]|nr:zinc-binding dehydrogenase [Porticoccaceae bacterium]
MRAAVIAEKNAHPDVRDFPAPEAREGALLIDVTAGAIGPTDLMRAAGFFGPVNGPLVAAGEGTGRLADGRRVYFGHAVHPWGAWAEKTLVPEAEVWPIPEGLDDIEALCLGLSGIGAIIPLEEARIQPGEGVLILGATGPLGQIALQVARVLGAGRVVAAARSATALQRLKDGGLADATVQLGAGDDLAALKAEAGSGYNVVLDTIYGPPAENAMRATAPGARMMSIGVGAGTTVSLTLGELVMRSHVGVGTGQRPAAERRAAWERVCAMAMAHGFQVDTRVFSLDGAPSAWQAQAGSPHGKVIVRP